MYAEVSEQPKRKHRSTLYRTARRLISQCHGGHAGIYWPREKLATWNDDDLVAVAAIAARADVHTMMIRGELCWHMEP